MTLTLHTNTDKTTLNILEEPDKNTIVTPPRSEVVNEISPPHQHKTTNEIIG